jgi:hypothetical protein
LAVGVFAISISFGKWNEYHSAEANHAQLSRTLVFIGVVLMAQSLWTIRNQKKTSQLEKELEEMKSRLDAKSTTYKKS